MLGFLYSNVQTKYSSILKCPKKRHAVHIDHIVRLCFSCYYVKRAIKGCISKKHQVSD
jgi:hypothetical protein